VEHHWNVLGPFAKRPNDEVDDVQPIEQVLMERSSLNAVEEVDARRRHESHIYARSGLPIHAPQQLLLRCRREGLDFLNQ
jgi:hypothetical protein